MYSVLSLSLLHILLLAATVQSANIAMFSFTGSASHVEIFHPIIEELIERGHNVTFYVGYKPRLQRPGLTNVYLQKSDEFYRKRLPPFFTKSGRNPNFLPEIFAVLRDVCDVAVREEDILKFRNRQENYDVTLVDALFHDCLLPLIYNKSNSVVYLGTAEPATNFHRLWSFNVPIPFSYVPNTMIFPFVSNMNFFERLANVFASVMFVYEDRSVTKAHADKVMQEHFPGLLTVKEVEERIPIFLTNYHPATNFPSPFAPSVIPIGGIHLKQTKPLPADLEKFVSESGVHGFIYVSFGTIVPAAHMPERAKKALIEALSRIPQRIIWKFDDAELKLSSNVKVVNWAPQQDLLAHPKIKAFVTHGGLFGFMETIYHGVPVIGLPVFADQPANIRKAEFYGMGVALDWETVTAEHVVDAINKVVNDPSYKENAVKRKNLFRDNLVPPRQVAAYWVEYVLHHQGSLHLRLPVEHLNLAQYFLLDVIAFLLALVVVVVWLVCKVVGLVVKAVKGGKSHRKVE